MENPEYQFHFAEGNRDWWQVGMRACTRSVLPVQMDEFSAIDCGAGAGYFVRELIDAGAQARGVELNAEAVAWSERLGNAQWLSQGRFQDYLPLDESLQLVTLLDVLPHREVNETEALRLIRRSLAPGGLLLMRLPAYSWLYGAHDVFVHQLRRYNKADVVALADNNGYQIERLTFANFFLFPLVLLNRFLEFLKKKAGMGKIRSSNAHLPRLINHVFRAILLFEARALRSGLNFPAGSSIIVIFRKQ